MNTEAGRWYDPAEGRTPWEMVGGFGSIGPTGSDKPPLFFPLCASIQSVCADVCVHVCVGEWRCAGGRQFMSMVLKTHSVNFLSLAAEVCDSSCSLWLSSHSLLIWPCSRTFSSCSCARGGAVGRINPSIKPVIRRLHLEKNKQTMPHE